MADRPPLADIRLSSSDGYMDLRSFSAAAAAVVVVDRCIALNLPLALRAIFLCSRYRTASAE